MFRGQKFFLSNFFPVEVEWDGKRYPSVEHAFQAAKTLDPVWRERIRQASTPQEARRLGRKAPLRPDWEQVKVGIMKELLRQKFSYAHLRQKLYQVPDEELVEINTWHDTFWGVCVCPKCKGQGKNVLGQLLKEVKMTARTFAGIGSRQTPPEILRLMEAIAHRLTTVYGYSLRSGGANGADSAFAAGAKVKEIYLPWPGYGLTQADGVVLVKPTLEAYEIAKQFHPVWDRLRPGVQALHARNVHVLLGKDLASPVDFVVAWTPGGEEVGGTGHALRVAKHYGIPVFNLYWKEKALNGIKEFLGV